MMNRFLKLETIFFVFLFSLFFTLSLEANGSGSKRYRDSFSNAPDPDLERERPVEKGKDDEKDDPGTKGGKTGKKKKKKTDISIPPGAGNEGSLVITLEAKSAQLTSFSNNGFSEPGAPVTLDPDSLSPISSDRSLFDQVRGDFIREGGKVVVDKNGLVESSDPVIGQPTWLPAPKNLLGITHFFSPGGGPLGSRNPAVVVTELSQIGENAGYSLLFPMIGQMNPATALIPPGLVAQNAPKPRSYVLTGSRTFLNEFLILYGATNMPGVTWKFNENWELEKYINYNREGVGRATFSMGLAAASLTGIGFIARPLKNLKRFIKGADDVAPTPAASTPSSRPDRMPVPVVAPTTPPRGFADLPPPRRTDRPGPRQVGPGREQSIPTSGPPTPLRPQRLGVAPHRNLNDDTDAVEEILDQFDDILRIVDPRGRPMIYTHPTERGLRVVRPPDPSGGPRRFVDIFVDPSNPQQLVTAEGVLQRELPNLLVQHPTGGLGGPPYMAMNDPIEGVKQLISQFLGKPTRTVAGDDFGNIDYIADLINQVTGRNEYDLMESAVNAYISFFR